MRILNQKIDWYVGKLEKNEPFSLGMYGDGEWLFLLRKIEHTQHFCRNTPEFAEKLKKGLLFRSDNYYFSMASVLLNYAWTGVGEADINKTLNGLGIEEDWEVHEKDMWDAEMKV